MCGRVIDGLSLPGPEAPRKLYAGRRQSDRYAECDAGRTLES